MKDQKDKKYRSFNWRKIDVYALIAMLIVGGGILIFTVVKYMWQYFF